MGNKKEALKAGEKIRVRMKASPEIKRSISSETQRFLNL